jgi:hypothetical protein
MVAHEQRNPVAGLQTCRLKLYGQVLCALRPLPMRGHNLAAQQNGRAFGGYAGLALQQVGEVQFRLRHIMAGILA